MPTSNEELLDSIVRHQIGLLRLSGSVRNRVIALLEESEASLRNQLEARLAGIVARGGFDLGPDTTARLGALEKALGAIRESAWAKVSQEWESQLQNLSVAEATWAATAIQVAAPVVLDLATPSAARLAAIAKATPFEGRILKDWADSLSRADRERIMSEIKIGLVNGETVKQISTRVMGGLQNGVPIAGATAVSKRGVEAVTRTAITAIADASRREVYKENADVLDQELYVATLDSRTTPVCRALDGKRFPLGKGPRPPQHMACRSVRVPVLDGDAIGTRPAKRASRADLEGLTAAERRQKIRDMTGTVPAKTTYQDFLRRQSDAFQEEVLGVTKAKLFRDGKLPLDRFIDRSGNELTLAQLMKRERAAFERAGLV